MAERKPRATKEESLKAKIAANLEEVKLKWHGDYFEILSYGGHVTGEEFDQFWDSIIQVDENLLY